MEKGDFISVFVNLSNIYENIVKIKQNVKKEVMIVLKSDAYGLGAKAILSFLNQKFYYFIVLNTVEEYYELKENLINNQVLILESVDNLFLKKNFANVHLAINSYEDYLRYQDYDYMLHIRIDTGMNRLGIKEHHEIVEVIKTSKNLVGVFTHFSSNGPYFYKQSAIFKKYIQIKNFEYVHCIASANLDKDIIGNYIRVGFAIYGFTKNISLKRSVQMTTKVIAYKKVLKQEAIGYNFISSIDQLIGVIPIGYFDINQLKLLHSNGRDYPVVANRCMNHSFIKVKKNSLCSCLYLFNKFDIIEERYNFYQQFTSLKNQKKNYIGVNYEIYKIYKNKAKRGKEERLRRRSYKDPCFRIIRFDRPGFFLKIK